METAKSRRKGAKQVRFSVEPKPKKMSSWLERQATSHQVQLAATAVFSGAVVAGLIYGGQAIRRKAAIDELKASIPELDDSHHADLVISFDFAPRKYIRINADYPSEAHQFRYCLSITCI